MSADLTELRIAWSHAWPHALTAWSRYTRLTPPRLCLREDEARSEGLTDSFAMIRFADQAIVVSLPQVQRRGIGGYPVEVLAHEVGHHVYAPANLGDHTRLLARMRKALPTLEHQAPLIANLYTDLLINDRLQRSCGLRMDEVYKAIATGPAGVVWALYLRIYELLWSCERGSLHGGATDDAIDGDAWLGARLVRSYARDWLSGGGRFASLLLPYLVADRKSAPQLAAWFDTRSAGAGGDPGGLTTTDPEERLGAIHPARDRELTGNADDMDADSAPPAEATIARGSPGGQGQAREPFEYGEILRAAGIALDDHEAAVRYYRERAQPHLIPFPSRTLPQSQDPLPEGLEPWEIGMSFDTIDWLQTVLASPRVIAGLTTVQRVIGTSTGHDSQREPLDLDLYVDSSGSMADPQRQVSYPALAGAIVGLSALRAGARVQVTLWSGKNQLQSTSGFVRDEHEILKVLTGYYGGGTAFPIHTLRDTWSSRTLADRPGHVLVISDDGVATLFDQDEQGNDGWEVAAGALAKARGGGTFVLNLIEQWEQHPGHDGGLARILRARDEQGWNVHRVASWEDLVVFAQAFSKLRFADPGKS